MKLDLNKSELELVLWCVRSRLASMEYYATDVTSGATEEQSTKASGEAVIAKRIADKLAALVAYEEARIFP